MRRRRPHRRPCRRPRRPRRLFDGDDAAAAPAGGGDVPRLAFAEIDADAFGEAVADDADEVAAGAEAAGAEVDEVPAGAEVDEVPAGAGADARQPNRGEAAALRRVIRSIMAAATHYEALGVAPDAADAEISEVYRDLARTVHPDKPLGDAAAFRRLADAKSVLLDANARARYDATLRSRRP